jgi:hypothetical protein
VKAEGVAVEGSRGGGVGGIDAEEGDAGDGRALLRVRETGEGKEKEQKAGSSHRSTTLEDGFISGQKIEIAARLRLNEFYVHEEIVHGPVWFDAALTDEAGELSVVADTVQKRMEEHGPAVGVQRSHGSSGEVDRVFPVVVFSGEKLLEDGDGAIVRGVDGFDGVESDSSVVGDGKVGETFGVAELCGDDVLEEFGDGFGACDVARFDEEVRVIG